ncbi:uncharacterized protein LOC135087199 isoform X1 [Ostrinia nubilalis]|uniref:uncharacterized protein LOC135087199 isoform X1 n=2 Tax=Ostrinia nubilalis TaxID=29057 RepID=UPI003082302F
MAKQDDGLFLLEVLIDKIVFVKSPCFSDKDFRTCVNIECPAVEPLEICDDDPGACVAKSGGPFVKTFNNGKSCLFSLKESDISSAMSKFPIKISVYKSLPCGCLPTKIVMGEATIDMTKEFVEARKKFLQDPTTVSYEALKDSFRITGPDGAETGEIVMFLRISCFGKLIITRFQGGGGPPNLGAGSGGNAIVDRSCNPRRDFQTSNDPCVCGAARGQGSAAGASGGGGAGGAPCSTCGAGGGGFGVCPPARDPYNTMPCQDPDDPCYCTGPKPPTKQPMVCRNTDQYCLHVPKGTLLNLPITQDLTEEQKLEIRASSKDMDKYRNHESVIENYNYMKLPINSSIHKYFEISDDHLKVPYKLYSASEKYSATSLSTIRSKRRSVSFSDTINYVSKSHHSIHSIKDENCKQDFFAGNEIFGKKETTVYMTLFDEFCRYQNSTQSTTGTQATASINKCLQVCCNNSLTDTTYQPGNLGISPHCYSSYAMSESPYRENRKLDKMRYSDVYFFGRKKDDSKTEKLGMGSSGSKSKRHRTEQTTTMPVTNESRTAQTRKSKGASAGTCTKTVSIKEEKPCPMEKPCPAVASVVKGEMVATVSHIRLGPREPCPVHGKEPCQGPKCIVASSGEEQAPVKITTMTNPRRGVFELVIRRITGAPLAKNELMLEWTPPPSRPPSCGLPCSVPCVPPVPCRPSKCKMIVCRPSPCKPKGCRKPCGPLPCRSVPCKLCCKVSCGGKPCRPCKPCKPCKPCRPCKPCPPPRCRPCKPVCCRPCRTCPPPRKIFKKPCPPPPCKPCKPCKPCPPSPCSLCMTCIPSPCNPCKPCRPPPCKPSPCRPPPCRPPPCRPCRPPPCRPCRPPPCRPCKPKPCRPPSPCKACRRCRPCPPSPCRACKRCRPPSPCGPCMPCPPALCAPCPPSPCSTPCSLPCCKSPCSSPCKSSPCLRPCPVGRKKTRKSKSSPKIKAHRKRISPCCNRSKTCPVVRCRSVPGPCPTCNGMPLCPPRKCCSISSCKSPKCCKSCSSCCD